MAFFMGIDGGGSTVRVVVTTAALEIKGEARGGTANPSVIGPEEGSRALQDAMRDALVDACVAPGDIIAACIGVAGADVRYAADWLCATVTGVLPDAQVVPSADYEIALVGALGARYGVLLLAGTGSLAYGVNGQGEDALVGGWGYLLDDAGSGYWLGAHALRAIVRAWEGRAQPTALAERLLAHLGLAQPLEIVPWLYHVTPTPTRDVAALAPLVLACADEGDMIAQELVTRGASELVRAAEAVIRRLKLDSPPLAFAGGLLTSSNRLSQAVCVGLELATIPRPRHSPVVGAALLARLTHEGRL